MEYVNDFKDVTLLFDFNNLVIRNFFGVKEILEDIENPQWGLWRYNCFNSIYTTLYKVANVKEVILAVDDSNSWRKAVYKRYKESRKAKKKETKVNWSELYAMMHKLAKEFKHHFPFRVLRVKSAEADDVIAVLVRAMKNPCIIIARDEDYFQLFGKKKELRVIDPIRQEIYKPEDFPDIRDFLLQLIFCGQKKDDIPNIYTPDDWGLTEATQGKRRPGFGPKKWESVRDDIKGFMDAGYTNKIYGSVDLQNNLKRNRMLMDFDKIPNTIVSRILDTYNNNGNFPPIENAYKYFTLYNMPTFIENIHKIENKLLELY